MKKETFTHKDVDYELRIISDDEYLYACVFKDGNRISEPIGKVSIETVHDAKSQNNIDLVSILISQSIEEIKNVE